jgi:hypothetical protein
VGECGFDLAGDQRARIHSPAQHGKGGHNDKFGRAIETLAAPSWLDQEWQRHLKWVRHDLHMIITFN